MSLVVNLFGGPGVSKSTNMALTFGKLKIAGFNVEMSPEYAKNLVWEDRKKALAYQPYIIGKQAYAIHRLIGQVDAIITDSPILFGLIYRGEGWDDAWANHVLQQHKEWNTLNILLERNREHHPYNPKGRMQTVSEALRIDIEMRDLLLTNDIPFMSIAVQEGEKTAEAITATVIERLTIDGNSTS